MYTYWYYSFVNVSVICNSELLVEEMLFLRFFFVWTPEARSRTNLVHCEYYLYRTGTNRERKKKWTTTNDACECIIIIVLFFYIYVSFGYRHVKSFFLLSVIIHSIINDMFICFFFTLYYPKVTKKNAFLSSSDYMYKTKLLKSRLIDPHKFM
jgi:hypothetical protein